MQSAQEKTQELSKVSQQVKGYTNDLKSVTSESPENMEEVGKTLEQKVASLEEIRQFQKEVEPVNDYTELMRKWASDPEVAKELALNKAKEQAVNHFAGHAEELMAAME